MRRSAITSLGNAPAPAPQAYTWAHIVVSSQSTEVDGMDGRALLPLSLRESPMPNMQWEEVVEERISSSGQVRAEEVG